MARLRRGENKRVSHYRFIQLYIQKPISQTTNSFAIENLHLPTMARLVFLICLFFFLPTVMSCDFLVLALQWPITYCRPPSNCRTGLPQSLTIRGLWPSTKFPPYPAHCVGKDLSLNMVCLIFFCLLKEWFV